MMGIETKQTLGLYRNCATRQWRVGCRVLRAGTSVSRQLLPLETKSQSWASQAIHEDPDDEDGAEGFSHNAAFDDGGLSILSASRGPVAWRGMD
jgi:hypothetical protein